MNGQPEVDRPPLRQEIRVSRLPQGGQRIRVEADEGERKAVAAFLSIQAVDRLVADVTAAPFGRGGVSFRGSIEAEIVQESVVSLAPVRQAVKEEIARTFLPEGSAVLLPRLDEAGEMEIDPEGEDPPDPFTGDTVDLGAALIEALALALDPYPREEDEAFRDRNAPAADDGTPEKVSPFAALAALKDEGAKR